MRRSLSPLACVLLLTAAVNSVPAQRTLGPIPLDAVAGTKAISGRVPITLSPDGEWVAFTVENTGEIQLPSPGDAPALFTKSGATKAAGFGRLEILLANTKNGESRRLTSAAARAWGPVWSPSGSHLAFYSDEDGAPRLWLWERPTGRIRKVSEAIVRPYEPFEVARWMDNGKKILCKLLPEGMTVEQAGQYSLANPPMGRADSSSPPGATVIILNSSSAARAEKEEEPGPVSGPREFGSSNLFLSDLALVEVATGRVERLKNNVRPSWFAPSPDEKYIAYNDLRVDRSQQQVRIKRDLLVYDRATKRTRVVFRDLRNKFGTAIAWSPDSRSLAFVTLTADFVAELKIGSVGAASTRTVSPTGGKFVSDERRPVWDQDGKSVYVLEEDSIWKVPADIGEARQIISRLAGKKILGVLGSRDGRLGKDEPLTVAIYDRTTKRVALRLVNVATGATDDLTTEMDVKVREPTFSSDAKPSLGKFIYVAENSDRPGDIWMIDRKKSRTAERITRVNPDFDKFEPGTVRLVDWKSAHGDPLQGALLLPPGHDGIKRYPLVVWIYGGDLSSDSLNAFGLGFAPVFNMHVLATRGYAVFFPDSPLRVGSPVKDLEATVMPGIDKLVEIGLADPDRLAVMGHSYGGYSTLALITRTKRFKAAVMSSGFGDLISLYGEIGILRRGGDVSYFETGQGRMGGTPWDQRDRYIENSPIFDLDKVETPLMLAYGTMDKTVPKAQNDAIFVGLRRLKKDAQYLQYAGEGHVVVSYANVLDFWDRRIKWLDHWLDVSRDQHGNIVWEGGRVKGGDKAAPRELED